MCSTRVFNIFKTWLDQYFNEEEDPEVLNRIEAFTEEVLAKDVQLKMPHQVLLRAVQRRVGQNETEQGVTIPIADSYFVNRLRGPTETSVPVGSRSRQHSHPLL